ncbi:MAG: Fic family protein [Chloroflexia bacterium]|nr:Fic family protein [Chloroflexia bacterium]
MRAEDFRDPTTGHVHRSFGGMDTFVPALLPPAISYEAVTMALSRADVKLSELSGAGRLLPNPHLLISPYLRREAVLSTRIEGTRTSLAEVFFAESVEDDDDRPPDADRQEVNNYVRALELGLARLEEGRPITLNLVLELHAVLMAGVRGQDKAPGRLRTVQNWIGGTRLDGSDAVFVPPPPELLMDCLSDWERFLNRRDLMPDLIQCAILHEQFEAIHPFVDGNGRMGRLLITLFLVERGRLSQPLLYLSSYIDANRDAYYDLLQAVRTDGDWENWILFFLHGVEETATEALSQTASLVDLREMFRAQVRGNAKATELVDYLFFNPYITARRAQSALRASPPTAYSAIAALEAAGILTETTGKRYGRRYLSTPIADILIGDRPETA